MELIQQAEHPKTKEIYTIGERICIYQGRFGHHNIMVIKSISIDSQGVVFVSDKENQVGGTYLSAVIEKISDKKLQQIKRGKSASEMYSKYQIM